MHLPFLEICIKSFLKNSWRHYLFNHANNWRCFWIRNKIVNFRYLIERADGPCHRMGFGFNVIHHNRMHILDDELLEDTIIGEDLKSFVWAREKDLLGENIFARVGDFKFFSSFKKFEGWAFKMSFNKALLEFFKRAFNNFDYFKKIWMFPSLLTLTNSTNISQRCQNSKSTPKYLPYRQ